MAAESPSKERFAVIGSNSFSAAAFVARALADGAEVLGISRSAELDPVFLPYRWAPHDRFRFLQLDLNQHSDSVAENLERFRPHYVVNFAAQGMVPQSWNHPEQWLETNGVAMVRLHDRLRKIEGLIRYVHLSTPEVYGSTDGLVTEETPYNPSTPYAVSKACADMSLQAFHGAYGFPAILARPSNYCGPGQQLYRIIPRTILYILNGKTLRLEGGGKAIRSFLNARCAADGLIRMAREGRNGEAYHLATDQNTTIRELVEQVCVRMGKSLEECTEVAPDRLVQDKAYLLDCGKAKRELDWSPTVALEETLDETIRWVKDNLDTLMRQDQEYVHKV